MNKLDLEFMEISMRTGDSITKMLIAEYQAHQFREAIFLGAINAIVAAARTFGISKDAALASLDEVYEVSLRDTIELPIAPGRQRGGR